MSLHTYSSTGIGRRIEATLADSTGPADVSAANMSWAVADFPAVLIRYRITRGATPDTAIGLMMISTEGVGSVTVFEHTGAVAPGVTFTMSVALGVATLQYTTTATGFSASMKARVIEEFDY